MIYCEAPTLEQWVAPPQEDFPRPTWTKLVAGGVMLSNSIEYADWAVDPVEPIVCESCWDSTCARAGLARIVHLGDYLLWLPPTLRDIDEFWRDLMSEANFIRAAVLMPVTTWEALREKFPRFPAPQRYRQATRGDLAALWLGEMPETVRVKELSDLEARLQEALASDPIDLVPARKVVRSMVRWILQSPQEHDRTDR